MLYSDVRGQPAGTSGRPAPTLVWLQVALAAFLCELLVIQVIGRTNLAGDLLPVLLPASHLVLAVFLVRNLSYWGLRLVLVGLALNLTVMAANGGLMPVDASAVNAVGRQDVAELKIGEPVPGTKNILLNRDDIHLRYLSDNIILPLPKPMTKAISLGDALILPGAIIAAVEVIRRKRRLGFDGHLRVSGAKAV
ncbi:MAG: DUF5317 domain-containing protein [Chloroflexota bacterium]